tara:strand:+ start:4285 stop:4704 length:420 start_codon:yes stop_codon:yes gene_type:complete
MVGQGSETISKSVLSLACGRSLVSKVGNLKRADISIAKFSKGTSIVNREMIYIHTFFIALTLFLVGLLCLTSATGLISTTFGKRVSLGLGIFFLLRLLVQFFGFSSKTWKGKALETTVHVLFSIFWTYVTGIFIFAYTL